MSKPPPVVAAALPARRKLGRPPKSSGDGPRVYKVASLFDGREWPLVERAAADAMTTPAGVIRLALRAYGVDVSKD
jgi:hypothetical protein